MQRWESWSGWGWRRFFKLSGALMCLCPAESKERKCSCCMFCRRLHEVNREEEEEEEEGYGERCKDKDRRRQKEGLRNDGCDNCYHHY